VPLTLNAWHQFLSRLSSAVNEQGKVLPTSTVRTWFDRLDDACGAAGLAAAPSLFGAPRTPSLGAAARSESQVRRAMEGVRERARREIGWLVGLRPEVAQGAGGMEGVEQEEEL